MVEGYVEGERVGQIPFVSFLGDFFEVGLVGVMGVGIVGGSCCCGGGGLRIGESCDLVEVVGWLEER